MCLKYLTVHVSLHLMIIVSVGYISLLLCLMLPLLYKVNILLAMLHSRTVPKLARLTICHCREPNLSTCCCSPNELTHMTYTDTHSPLSWDHCHILQTKTDCLMHRCLSHSPLPAFTNCTHTCHHIHQWFFLASALDINHSSPGELQVKLKEYS